MNRIACLLVSASLLSSGVVFAQGELDAYRYSQTELNGTARYLGMGGAFGALGGDISSMSSNPAGQVVSNCTRLREAATGAASTMATAALISHEARIVIALLGVLMLLREVVVAATVRAPSVEVAAVREVVAAEAAGVDKDRNVWRSKK